MTSIPLTSRLLAKLDALFTGDDRATAQQWLLTECGPELQGGFADADWVERTRAAALKQSNGSLDALRNALTLANKDWRDLLMAVGFGQELDAHTRWLDGV